MRGGRVGGTLWNSKDSSSLLRPGERNGGEEREFRNTEMREGGIEEERNREEGVEEWKDGEGGEKDRGKEGQR